jgi:hypothetical protein
MTKESGGGSNPPTNPMPPLLAAVREALKESIRCHGVICPVVKDQTGYVLDGHNRIDIAGELGVACPEVIHECEAGQREILRVELNGARRQIGPEEWKPLVDHLRCQVTPDGARRFSDRVIATAVGVDRNAVQRYKSPVSPTDSSESVGSKNVGEDGKVRHVGGDWTAVDRALHLIRQSAEGLTTEDLARDEVLAEFGGRTPSTLPSTLRDRGLVIAAGKRGRHTIWKAVPEDQASPPPQKPAVARKAERVIEDLADAEVRDEVKAQLADRKGVRQADALLRAAEKELEAAEVAEQQRAADEEKERLRLIEVARSQADKSVKTWDKLIAEMRAAWTVIAAYMEVFGDLPAIHPSYERMLDREMAELQRQLDWFDRRLHPDGHRPVTKGSWIDV